MGISVKARTSAITKTMHQNNTRVMRARSLANVEKKMADPQRSEKKTREIDEHNRRVYKLMGW